MAAPWLAEEQVEGLTRSFIYDGANCSTYEYDGLGMMNSEHATYRYDGDGRRLWKAPASQPTQPNKLYWYGVGSDPSEETNLSGTATADYIFFNGKRTARLDLPSATVHYYFANHLGSANVVTSSTGAIQDESDFYPFGGERVITDTDPNQYKFTGKERDTESGLDFFIARYYSSGYGRFPSPDEFTGGPVDAFSSSDPLPPGPLPYADIFNPQSLNKYSYTYNNPLRYTDPDGHDVWDFLSGIGNATRSNAVAGLGRQEGNSDFELGQSVGDAISVLGGAIEMLGGSTMAGGGAAACVTGAGCLAGAPVAVAGVAVAAHGATMAGTAISNIIQKNPYGSGGAPDHQQTAAEEATKLGPTGEREVTIKTPGGEKGSRRADAARVNPSTGKVTNPVQVYRPTKRGQIPAREQRAARDIQKARGQKPKMVPVRPLKKPEVER